MIATYVGNNNMKINVYLTLEGHFYIFYVFACKPKYSCTIMYECEKSQPPHELSYIGLFNFSH